MKYTELFKPYKLSPTLELKNKIIMAPLTRCFSDDDLVPTKEMAKYYAKRADAGLIVSEATLISFQAQGYPNMPGIYNQSQILGWKEVNNAVHAKGGKIFCQIWHAGRVSHKVYTGELPVSSSASSISGPVPRTDEHYETPRALELTEIKSIVQDYVQAAKNSIEAGFDGIEIHGANGYLIDQFIHQETNFRDDIYGGSIQNRARFALEIVDEIIEAIGKDKVSIRLSPNAHNFMSHTDGDEETFKYLLSELDKRNILYVHLGSFDDNEEIDYLGGRASAFIKKHYAGTVIGSGSYTFDKAEVSLIKKDYDLAAIGRPFIANPDLIERLQNETKLLEYSEDMLNTLI